MVLGKQHIYLDFGSKVGFDKCYPRQALLNLSDRKTIRFNLDESFIYNNIETSIKYLQERVDEFLEKLNF